MEAVATPDACANPCGFMEESPAMAARRRRMEIRRFKLMTNSGNFVDVVKKRSRTQGGQFCNSCFGDEEGPIDGDSDGAMEIENATLHTQGLYPPGRLVRSVSTPTGWNGGLFCTCSSEKYWAGDGSRRENTIKNDGGDNSDDADNNSRNDVAVNESNSGSDGAEPMESEQQQQQQNPKQGRQDTPQTTKSNDEEGALPSAGAEQRSSNEKKSLLNRNLKGICRANSESISVLLKDPCPPHGTMSIIGRRREMEDAVSVIPSFFSLPKSSCSSALQQELNGFVPPPSAPLHFFAVYDGHGGSQASIFCKDRFHEALAQELRNSYAFSRDLSDWTKVMSACFTKMDIEVGGLCPSGSCGSGELDRNVDCCQDPIAPENVGSTAVVAVVSPSQVVIANCGDSRAVLCRGGKAIPLSKDHKPEREDEMVRIEAAGGRVIFWNGYRVGGFLAMSRAIGDRYLKRYVISEPEVTCTERTPEDECLILASDGLWDVLSNDTVCEVARKCLAGYRPHRSKGITEDTPVAAAAALLTKLALGRGSGDNISVVVIDLKEKRNRNR